MAPSKSPRLLRCYGGRRHPPHDSSHNSFADNGINICGQFLQTNEKVGYVVIDVDKEYSDLALEKLQHVNGTIRSRVLF